MKGSHKAHKKKNPKSKFPLFQIFSVLVPIILLVSIGILHNINSSVKKETRESTLPTFASSYTLSSYPVSKQVITPFVSAQSAIIMEDSSKVILYAKNSHLRLSTASTAKIMTALVGLDYFSKSDILASYSDTIEGTVVGIKRGQRYSFEDLLYAMLLPSGNDAAYTIAQNYPGGVAAFVGEMNARAKELHLLNTHFADPAGLDDNGNYSTASDLAYMSSYALKNKTFSHIASTKQKVIRDVDGTVTYDIDNLNKLLGIQGVTGVKTGFTEGAMGVLVTSKIENGHVFILVVMKSQDRFYDTRQLMSLVSDNITFFQPVFQLSAQ